MSPLQNDARAGWAACAAMRWPRGSSCRRKRGGKSRFEIRSVEDVWYRTVIRDRRFNQDSRDLVSIQGFFFSSIVVYARATTRWRRTTIDFRFSVFVGVNEVVCTEGDGSRNVFQFSLPARGGRRTPISLRGRAHSLSRGHALAAQERV